MPEGLFYEISKSEAGFCYIRTWFDSVHKSYQNAVAASFDTDPDGELYASWAIEARSYAEMVRLLAVAHKFAVDPNKPGERDDVDIDKLLTYLEEVGCQVVKDPRLNKWVRVSELDPGELWEIDREAMRHAYPAQRFYPFETVAEYADQAKRRIASAIALSGGKWDFLREWLDECLPVAKNTEKKAPEVITLDMVREFLKARQPEE